MSRKFFKDILLLRDLIKLPSDNYHTMSVVITESHDRLLFVINTAHKKQIRIVTRCGCFWGLQNFSATAYEFFRLG